MLWGLGKLEAIRLRRDAGAEVLAQDLAAGGLRNGVDELDMMHFFVGGDHASDVSFHVLSGQPRAGGRDDEGLRRLAAFAP